VRSELVEITPLIPSGGSLEAALEFYTRYMSFSIVWRSDTMAGIRRDRIAFNASFSIGVANLEALFEEYRGLPAQVGPLEMKPWGRREFHLIVPSGVCLQFYEQRVT
jgi:hypothetical protein